MSRHRAPVRLRWGRIVASTGAAVVLVGAIVGAVGYGDHRGGSAAAQTPFSPSVSPSRRIAEDLGGPSETPASSESASGRLAPASPTTSPSADHSAKSDPAALPADSGTGRRAVYDISDQRVWIVDASGAVQRTYLVSGSVEDNLKTGTYAVYSRSLDAEGVDNSGYMRYFVRFAHGTDQGAAIGFHEIPTTAPDGHGRPLQTVAQLGHPESHGCIRQATADAVAMWDFAQVGTKVVVLA